MISDKKSAFIRMFAFHVISRKLIVYSKKVNMTGILNVYVILTCCKIY